MSASSSVPNPRESVSGIGPPIAVILDRNADNSDPHSLPLKPSQTETPACRGTLEQKTGKLSARERLNRLSESRIYPGAFIGTLEPIGRGGKAEVARALCEHTRDGVKSIEAVAVKKAPCGSDTMEEEKLFKEFVHEVEILAGLSHVNVIRLVGFVEDPDQKTAWIVLSWEPNGNVRDFLACGEWEIPERLSLIQDTFRGLEYLHTRDPPICHGDLKSLNILVSSSYHAVITDFGSARTLQDTVLKAPDQGNISDASGPSTEGETAACHQITIVPTGDQLTLTGPAWTLRWAAPEVVRDEEQPSLPSDIWSAGWVCWEVVTGEIPFQKFKSSPAVTLQVVQGKVPSTRDHAQLAQVIRLCSLMADCWALSPKNRPTAARCYNDIEWMPSRLPSGGMPPGHEVSPVDLLLQMGELYYLQGRNENAVALCRQALTIARQEEDLVASAMALSSLARVYYTQSKYTEAIESYAEAQELSAHIGDDMGQANTLHGLGEVYRAQSKYVKAAEYFNQALEIYTCADFDLGRANALSGLGSVCRARSKYAAAAEYYHQAQEIYVLIGEDQGRANTLLELGAVHYAQTKHAAAVEFYNRAQEIYARVGDDQGRANTLGALGDVYHDQGKYTEAAESYNQAQEIYACIGDDLGHANTLRGLGAVYYSQRNFTAAADAYSQAEEIYTRIGSPVGQANALCGLGHTHRDQGEYATAAEFYKQAQEIFARIGHDQGQANTLRGLGQLHRIQGLSNEAAAFYEEAKKLYAEMGDIEGEQHVSHWLNVLSKG